MEGESAESAESAKQKNDVAEVAEMAENRVLNDNLCHLCHLCQCKFLYKRLKWKRIFYICLKLPKMDQKLLNGELNELSECFYFRTRGIGILRSRPG